MSDNFLHLWLIVEAARLEAAGDYWQAMQTYAQAMEQSQQYGFLFYFCLFNFFGSRLVFNSWEFFLS